MSLINNSKYRPYLLTSLALHVLLLFLLIFNISFDKTEKVKLSKNTQNHSLQPEIVKAHTVDNKLVEKEIARLNKIEADKKYSEQQRQKN